MPLDLAREKRSKRRVGGWAMSARMIRVTGVLGVAPERRDFLTRISLARTWPRKPPPPVMTTFMVRVRGLRRMKNEELSYDKIRIENFITIILFLYKVPYETLLLSTRESFVFIN